MDAQTTNIDEAEFRKFQIMPQAFERWNELQHQLGKGSSGNIVFKTRKLDGEHGEFMIVKRIPKSTANQPIKPNDYIAVEVRNLIRIRNSDVPHFIEFYGWRDSPDHLYIIMEYCEFGSLGKGDKDFTIGDPLYRNEIRSIARQLLLGLKAIHEAMIVHRDINPRNILVSAREPSLHVKIADFGVSKYIDGTDPRTNTGTNLYKAPEIFFGLMDEVGYTVNVDIWSLGCVLFWMHNEVPPFQKTLDIKHYYWPSDKKDQPLQCDDINEPPCPSREGEVCASCGWLENVRDTHLRNLIRGLTMRLPELRIDTQSALAMIDSHP